MKPSKKNLKLTLSIFLLSTLFTFAQNFPYGINYQGVARDANGNAQTTHTVNIRFTIAPSTSTTTVVYQETQTKVTNNMGQFNAIIGTGTSAQTFSTIAWNGPANSLVVEIDPGGGYQLIGVQPFQAVPYALHALTKAPTMQIFLSGAATYTTPANVLYIEVEMCGGGGCGGSGSTGGNTSFGTSLLLANGGTEGILGVPSNGGDGGSASISLPAVGYAVSGGAGTGGAKGGTANGDFSMGGAGGSNPFGGGGGGGYGESAANIGTGYAGKANTGGGGGGNGASSNARSAGGGGAGGYVKAMISNPSSTYLYSVGAGGTGGNGGAGGSGVIIVREYYK